MTTHLKNIVSYIATCCLIFTMSITASATANAAEFSFGHGIQYSGITGIQVASKHNNHNFRAAVGIVGLGIGYDYFLNDQFSIGASQFIGFEDGTALNINYYPSGYTQGRWILGIDVGRVKDGFDWPTNCIIDCENQKDKASTIMWLSVGYKF